MYKLYFKKNLIIYLIKVHILFIFLEVSIIFKINN